MKTIQEIFEKSLFRIPDYQRGYSWKERQLNDFWQDIQNLRLNKLHYTGHITLNEASKEKFSNWKEDSWTIKQLNYQPFYIVDGQQRITTIILLINALVNALENNETYLGLSKSEIISKYLYKTNHKGSLVSYIFGYEIDDPSDAYLKKEIFNKTNSKSNQSETIYTNNLEIANKFFKKNLLDISSKERETIFKKLTTQLVFDIEPLGKGLDIFVVFETLNNRGKPITNLEKLKNRLIYLSTLISKITTSEQVVLRDEINSTWKDIYEYLGKNKKNSLDDDEFLRTHFILYYYFQKEKGFPYDNIFDEIFNVSNTVAAKPSVNINSITKYIRSLRKAVEVWYKIRNPELAFEYELLSQAESKWLGRINRLKVSIFYPLILAAFMKEGNEGDRIKLLSKIESFCFLNYYCAGKRSSYGNTEFPSMASEYFSGGITLSDVNEQIEIWTRGDEGAYSIEKFIANITDYMKSSRKEGYYEWPGIRYLLFEYDEMLRGKEPSRVKYETHNSIEHIYPQNDSNPAWRKDFTNLTSTQKKYLRNSLGNLVLIKGSKNSSLSNDSYLEKTQYVYKNSKSGYLHGSHSEVDLATNYKRWRPKEIYLRGKEILHFLCKHWNVNMTPKQMKTLLLIDSKLIAKIR